MSKAKTRGSSSWCRYYRLGVQERENEQYSGRRGSSSSCCRRPFCLEEGRGGVEREGGCEGEHSRDGEALAGAVLHLAASKGRWVAKRVSQRSEDLKLEVCLEARYLEMVTMDGQAAAGLLRLFWAQRGGRRERGEGGHGGEGN